MKSQSLVKLVKRIMALSVIFSLIIHGDMLVQAQQMTASPQESTQRPGVDPFAVDPNSASDDGNGAGQDYDSGPLSPSTQIAEDPETQVIAAAAVVPGEELVLSQDDKIKKAAQDYLIAFVDPETLAKLNKATQEVADASAEHEIAAATLADLKKELQSKNEELTQANASYKNSPAYKNLTAAQNSLTAQNKRLADARDNLIAARKTGNDKKIKAAIERKTAVEKAVQSAKNALGKAQQVLNNSPAALNLNRAKNAVNAIAREVNIQKIAVDRTAAALAAKKAAAASIDTHVVIHGRTVLSRRVEFEDVDGGARVKSETLYFSDGVSVKESSSFVYHGSFAATKTTQTYSSPGVLSGTSEEFVGFNEFGEKFSMIKKYDDKNNLISMERIYIEGVFGEVRESTYFETYLKQPDWSVDVRIKSSNKTYAGSKVSETLYKYSSSGSKDFYTSTTIRYDSQLSIVGETKYEVFRPAGNSKRVIRDSYIKNDGSVALRTATVDDYYPSGQVKTHFQYEYTHPSSEASFTMRTYDFFESGELKSEAVEHFNLGE